MLWYDFHQHKQKSLPLPFLTRTMPVQVPTVEGIGQDSVLLYEAESEEVVVARDTFASLRQYLVTLQQEVRRNLM